MTSGSQLGIWELTLMHEKTIVIIVLFDCNQLLDQLWENPFHPLNFQIDEIVFTKKIIIPYKLGKMLLTNYLISFFGHFKLQTSPNRSA